MFPLGFVELVVGMFLLDCAIQNRKVIPTVEGIITDPANMRATLAKSKGTGYAPTPSPAPPATGGGSAATSASYSGAATGAAAGAVAFARQQIGKPYQWGATGPNAYDCSGLVQAAYASVGVKLARVSQAQALQGSRVDRSSLQVGDLIFPDLGHVQIYSGNGNVIEAPSAGKSVREVPMWGFFTARRVAAASSGGTVAA